MKLEFKTVSRCVNSTLPEPDETHFYIAKDTGTTRKSQRGDIYVLVKETKGWIFKCGYCGHSGHCHTHTEAIDRAVKLHDEIYYVSLMELVQALPADSRLLTQ